MAYRINPNTLFTSALVTLTIACSKHEPTAAPPGTGTGSGDGGAGQVGSGPTDSNVVVTSATVSGIALDAAGQPIRGATIWVRPAVTTGLLSTTTDATGRYNVRAAFSIPYYTYAWATMTYAGKPVCMRLAATKLEDYDSFVPRAPVVHNFRLSASGQVGNDPTMHFGGDLRLFVPSPPAGSRLMVMLKPTQPLIDGTTGTPVTYDAFENDLLISDVPIGVYSASAYFIDAQGVRTRLEVGNAGYGGPWSATSPVQFHSSGSCVGSSGSGVEREFLYIHVPGNE